MTIYVISDTHFGHANILKFTGADGALIRPGFTDVAHMNAYMIEKWNSVVTPEDHIYHLGDFSMRKDDALKIVRKLNGHKRLLLGNHDKEDVRLYRDAGFQKVMSYRYFDRKVILSHVPIHAFSLGSRVNLHGHIHEKESPPGRYVNMSVERWDYTPQPLEAMIALGESRVTADALVQPV